MPASAINTRSLSKIVGVSEVTLVRLSELPDCPAYHVGRVLRWPIPETLGWLQQRRYLRPSQSSTNAASVKKGGRR